MAASLRRQGLGQRPPGSSARSLPRTRPACIRKSVGAGFYTSGPNQKWAGDITYLRTDEGWLYLAVVIDLWSRAVIGWSMSPRMTAQLACDALQMALWRRTRPGTLSFTRTVEASTVQQIIRRNWKRHNLRGSMSAKGCCYDNACVESFHSLKVEYPWRTLYQPGNNAGNVFNYIECDYKSVAAAQLVWRPQSGTI